MASVDVLAQLSDQSRASLSAWAGRDRAAAAAALAWWLGSIVVFGGSVAVFDDLVYGGPLKSGYRPGEITFSLSAVLPNLRYMPAHLIEAVPVLVLGLGAWSFSTMRNLQLGGVIVVHGGRPGLPPPGGSPGDAGLRGQARSGS